MKTNNDSDCRTWWGPERGLFSLDPWTWHKRAGKEIKWPRFFARAQSFYISHLLEFASRSTDNEKEDLLITRSAKKKTQIFTAMNQQIVLLLLLSGWRRSTGFTGIGRHGGEPGESIISFRNGEWYAIRPLSTWLNRKIAIFLYEKRDLYIGLTNTRLNTNTIG